MDMQNCTLCPRLCHVDRTKNYGVCHASDKVEIALVSLHRWEEPCLSGTNGAGTVFSLIVVCDVFSAKIMKLVQRAKAMK